MKKLLPLALLPLLLFACKKDKDENINTTPTPEAKFTAMPLAIGNYWVYEKFTIDTDGVETFDGLDSLYVSGIEIMHNDTFYKVNGGSVYTLYGSSSFRDSTGYLVNPYGIIYFAQNNYTDTLAIDTVPTLYIIYSYMTEKGNTVTVPAGTYTQTGKYLSYCDKFETSSYPWGDREAYFIFANNVGLVKRRLFFSAQPDYIEARLLRYHVQ